MTLPIRIRTTHTLVTTTEVELPAGRSWAEVKDWGVKWGSLEITWADGSTTQLQLDPPDTEQLDEVKTPEKVEIWQEELVIDELADWDGEGSCPKCQGDGCDPLGGCVHDE